MSKIVTLENNEFDNELDLEGGDVVISQGGFSYLVNEVTIGDAILLTSLKTGKCHRLSDLNGVTRIGKIKETTCKRPSATETFDIVVKKDYYTELEGGDIIIWEGGGLYIVDSGAECYISLEDGVCVNHDVFETEPIYIGKIQHLLCD